MGYVNHGTWNSLERLYLRKILNNIPQMALLFAPYRLSRIFTAGHDLPCVYILHV